MRLLRVVPVGRDLEFADDGVRVVITSVELWDGLVAIRSTVVGDGPVFLNVAGRRRRFAGSPGAPSLELADDVGTRYDRSGGGGGGGGHPDRINAWWMHMTFRPAVPDAARLLRVRSRAASSAIEIPLD